MTAVRLIPCLDIDQGRVVKGVNFVNVRDAGDPVELARHYGDEGADELVFLDITASHEGRPNAIELAEHVAEQVFIPFTVGGGLSDLEDMRDVLLAGADKVSLNSAAVADPWLISRAADKFGSQCVVVAIDARSTGQGWEVYTHGGRRPTGIAAVEWASRAAGLGAGEILLTSMDGDGTRQGYANDLNRAVSDAVGIPVIASGGAGNAAHLVDAVRIGGVDAVLLAGILHDKETTIRSLKEEMAAAGLTVRL